MLEMGCFSDLCCLRHKVLARTKTIGDLEYNWNNWKVIVLSRVQIHCNVMSYTLLDMSWRSRSPSKFRCAFRLDFIMTLHQLRQ